MTVVVVVVSDNWKQMDDEQDERERERERERDNNDVDHERWCIVYDNLSKLNAWKWKWIKAIYVEIINEKEEWKEKIENERLKHYKLSVRMLYAIKNNNNFKLYRG